MISILFDQYSHILKPELCDIRIKFIKFEQVQEVGVYPLLRAAYFIRNTILHVPSKIGLFEFIV